MFERGIFLVPAELDVPQTGMKNVKKYEKKWS